MFGDYPFKLRWVWLTAFAVWSISVLLFDLTAENAACLFYFCVGSVCLYMIYAKEKRCG